ncbi:hypothetical protein JCM8097_002458 [Rhodosporidiobolus ruineniae]
MRASLFLAAFSALSLVAAAPAPEASTVTGGELNLFGYERPPPAPPAAVPSSSAASAPASTYTSQGKAAEAPYHPPSVAWDPLNLAGGAFLSQQRRSKPLRVSNERWTLAPETAETTLGGAGEEEEPAEGDEEEDEQDEGEDDGAEGDMLGPDGWFRRRSRRSLVVSRPTTSRRMARRSWKEKR